MANFVRVDASRSFDQVLADVTQQIMEFLASTYPQDAGDNRKPALMEER
jgi:hypothetical protein